MQPERLVQLADGRMVPSHSEAWRMECEARLVMGMPADERTVYLQGIAAKRGRDAAQQLLNHARNLYRLTHHQRTHNHEH